MKVLYRIDNFEQKRGIWRDWDGNWNPVFDEFLQDGVSKDLPMEDNKTYQGGWFAATESLETLIPHWVSFDDLRKLYKHGWVVQSYLCEEQYTKKLNDYETIFLKEKATPYAPFWNLDALEIMLSDFSKSRLNDNEVREVARMQQELDNVYYALFNLSCLAGADISWAEFIESPKIDSAKSVRVLYDFIIKHIETPKIKETRTRTITKHGNIKNFKGKCGRCKCEFEADVSYVSISNGYDISYCPECGLRVIVKPIYKEEKQTTISNEQKNEK